MLKDNFAPYVNCFAKLPSSPDFHPLYKSAQPFCTKPLKLFFIYILAFNLFYKTLFCFLKLQFSPCSSLFDFNLNLNFKPLYLLNCSCDSGNSCAHTFVVTSRSFQCCLFSTCEMFDVLFYLCTVVCVSDYH
jgi:hypothetical protein